MTQEQVGEKLKALTDELNAHGYHHLIVVGKNGKCSRYFNGNKSDLALMLVGMMENNPDFGQAVNEILQTNNK